ncbi:MAG: ParB/RepB/Spo0J family partition protein [Thermovirgaceae bacterium]
MARKKALGRGLGALIPGGNGDGGQPSGDGGVREVAISSLSPSPFQPRKTFDSTALNSLADSIKEHGVVQPVLARASDGRYEIVAGERRWRAAELAGLEKIPVKVIEADDHAVMEISLVENLQREDLSPLEAAWGIEELISRFSLTQEQAAKRIGWSRVAVTNTLRLLQLPEAVLGMLHAGDLSEGHARVLLALKKEEDRLHLARLAVDKGLTVRELEQAVRRVAEGATMGKKRKTSTMRLPEPARRFSEQWGVSVKLSGNPSKLRVVLEGLNEKQARELFELLEDQGERLFPGE